MEGREEPGHMDNWEEPRRDDQEEPVSVDDQEQVDCGFSSILDKADLNAVSTGALFDTEPEEDHHYSVR